MVYLRKARAGSCNLGPASGRYTWTEDGSVVEVDPEHARKLLEIPFNDFTVVDAPEPEAGREGDSQDAEDKKLIEEPAPEASISETPPERKAPAKKSAPAPVKAAATAAAKSAVKE